MLFRSIVSGPIHVRTKIPEAVQLALSLAETPDLVLIAGSLYLISDARWILKEHPLIKARTEQLR